MIVSENLGERRYREMIKNVSGPFTCAGIVVLLVVVFLSMYFNMGSDQSEPENLQPTYAVEVRLLVRDDLKQELDASDLQFIESIVKNFESKLQKAVDAARQENITELDLLNSELLGDKDGEELIKRKSPAPPKFRRPFEED